MIKVLFVCLGNICRSPLAEGIFDKLVDEQNLSAQISSDSAGTSNFHIGAQPDRRSIQIAQNHNILLSHKGRQFLAADFENFDYIVAMDQQNFRDILSLQKNRADFVEKVYLIRDFESNSVGEKDVPDPYWDQVDGFQRVYDILDNCLINFLGFIKKEHNLS